MFTKFKNDLKTVFLDIDSEIFQSDSNQKLNIILSPSLYWVKKLDLPVKYLHEVKKLAPSLFEDVLPTGNYSYTAYKKDDMYFLFAYEDKAILNLLNEKNISISNIKNVYFAQNEFREMEHSIQISEKQSLHLKDGLIIVLPLAWVKKVVPLDLENIKLSKNKITLAQFGHIVDKKSIYKIGLILGIMALLLSVEWFISSEKIAKVNETREELFEKYKLKPTMLQNKSLMKKYVKIHKRQEKIRESIAQIITVKLSTSYSLTFLDIKNKLLIANFSIKNNSEKEKIINTLKSKGLVFKSSFKDNKLLVEVAL